MEKLGNYIEGNWIFGEGDGQPIMDAVSGEAFVSATSKGIDFDAMLNYGRTVGNPALRKMTFYERGKMLKKLALYLTRKKEAFYELSYRTGATKTDSWIDIEGGFGNLFANASLRRNLPNLPYLVDGEAIDLSRGEGFMGHHIMVPKEGLAIHINAFNFPVWGMLEKCAVNWMAGIPAVVKPATATSFLTEAVVREIIASKILPEGALQLICGSARTLLDVAGSQDVVTFTGSATTGRMLKSNPQIINEAVPFNMEADSLNCAVLGPDAVPGTDAFNLFIKEVRNEMTVKCGQKCTAIRRIIVPENLVEDTQVALAKALDKVSIGDPRLKEVRMGALVNKDQVEEVKQQIATISVTASKVYGSLNGIEVIGANSDTGAFLSPVLLREDHPHTNLAVHEVEAFGPVSTIMPYKKIDDAIALAKLGKGSLCCSIATEDNVVAKEFVIGAATHHGRILVINKESSKRSTGHGSPLPTLVHGGPGRAGGGEEMGGIRGLKHYMQRCAIQGSPTTITAITETFQPGSDYLDIENHPFKYHFEDIKVGQSLLTHKRTITDSDIINFGNLSWDHFYAHTDITSLEGSIFEKRTAHGYFILSAAAGLFVYPNKGPVAANYGLESCRFTKPLYHNDTIQVRLTCQEKMERDHKGKELPAGVVKWLVEVYDETKEICAVATILTLVQKTSPFPKISSDYLSKQLSKLTPTTKAKWGILESQHMVEHLEFQLKMGTNEIINETVTPPDLIEKYLEFVWSYKPIPKHFQFPTLRKNEKEDLKHSSLPEAIASLLTSYEAFEKYFHDNPLAKPINPVYGEMTKMEWQLLTRKHVDHHFKQFGIA